MKEGTGEGRRMKRGEKKINWLLPGRFWHSAPNRRKFFEEYAREHYFDPRIPTNWYEVSREDIMTSKVPISSIPRSYSLLSFPFRSLPVRKNQQFSSSLLH
jgi:hypothetical protein